MSKSPSSQRWLADQFAGVHHKVGPSNRTKRILADRRAKQDVKADGMFSRLGEPREHSHSAESAGHYRWRTKAKNIANKRQRNGQTFEPKQHILPIKWTGVLPNESAYVAPKLPTPLAPANGTVEDAAKVIRQYSQ